MKGFDHSAPEVAHAAPRARARSDQQRQREDGSSTILGLQRTVGNAAVNSLLGPAPPEPDLAASRVSFEAVIGRAPEPERATARVERPSSAHPGRPDLDGEQDHEGVTSVDPAAVTSAFTLPASSIPDAQPGQTVPLPDLQMPAALEVVDTDAVAGAITFSPTVTQSGTVDPFGATTWSKFNITGTTVTAAAGTFNARFTLENPITFNVDSPKTSIASENDGALTNANFAKAASDLTPNMARQGGKPPRTRFWARDLTVKHEKFHSDERSRLNKAGADQAQTWLNGQTATSVADVQALIAQVPGKVITASQAAVGTVDEKESRAYADGAPSYQARADAISAKGAKGTANGGYP